MINSDFIKSMESAMISEKKYAAMLWTDGHPVSGKLTYLLEEANELKDLLIDDDRPDTAAQRCVNMAVFAMKIYEHVRRKEQERVRKEIG